MLGLYRRNSTHKTTVRIPVSLLLVAAGSLFAQGQQFGGYTFRPPAGYSQQAAGTQLQLVKMDTKRRTFCQMALQPAQAALDSGARELDTEWQLLVTRQYQLKSAPATNAIQMSGGRGASEGLERAASTSTSNVPSMISKVLVARFPGRYVSVLLNSSGTDIVQSCTDDAVGLLSSVRFAEAAAPVPAASVAQPPPVNRPQGARRIPTGNTPLLFPGMPDWLPSGNGVPIPDPGFVRGLPVGLWWVADAEGVGNIKADLHIFLEGGIRASSPRLGGPRLYDLEGQKQQRGVTGVGSYTIENGQMLQRSDSFRYGGPYSTGSDSAGTFFKVGGSVYRPLTTATAQSIVGHWKGYQLEISFRADGTYVYGPPAASTGSAGTYVLDGYLIQKAAHSGPAIIDRVGMSGDLLILGRYVLSRVR